MTPPTELLICTTCRPAGEPREGTPAGARLHEAVLAGLAASAAAHCAQGDSAQPAGLQVRGIACLSACSRSCVAALQAPGKHSYVFGDLPADADSAAQLLTVARQHQQAVDGVLPWRERPQRLRQGMLVRLPPLEC